MFAPRVLTGTNHQLINIPAAHGRYTLNYLPRTVRERNMISGDAFTQFDATHANAVRAHCEEQQNRTFMKTKY